jgi:hypothetical protein
VPVLNREDVVWIKSSNGQKIIEKRGLTVSVRACNFEELSENYVCIEFFNGDVFDNISIESVLGNTIIDDLKSRKCVLALCNAHESFHEVVEPLYRKLVLSYHIPPEQILLMSGSANILQEVNRISQKYNHTPIKCAWILELEFALQSEHEWSIMFDYMYINREEYTIELEKRVAQNIKRRLSTTVTKTKKYLCLNRRWRWFRPTLVALLTVHNLLDKGHMSLGRADISDTWDKIWPSIVHRFHAYPSIQKLLVTNQHKVLNLGDLYIDTNDLITNRAALDSKTNWMYEQTHFSVITETNYDTAGIFNNNIFLTEKVFKTIVHMHPFILVSVAGSLAALRKIGYKTFSPYIDETYDNETDDIKRLLLIIKEIQRLCSLTDEELAEFDKGVAEICTYNYKVFMEKKNFLYVQN